MCYVLDREVVAKKVEFVVWRANRWVSSPLPSMNSWTQYMQYYFHTVLTDLFVN